MKYIYHCYTANWDNIKLYPRIWYNKSNSTPNFKHKSGNLRGDIVGAKHYGLL